MFRYLITLLTLIGLSLALEPYQEIRILLNLKEKKVYYTVRREVRNYLLTHAHIDAFAKWANGFLGKLHVVLDGNKVIREKLIEYRIIPREEFERFVNTRIREILEREAALFYINVIQLIGEEGLIERLEIGSRNIPNTGGLGSTPNVNVNTGISRGKIVSETVVGLLEGFITDEIMARLIKTISSIVSKEITLMLENGFCLAFPFPLPLIRGICFTIVDGIVNIIGLIKGDDKGKERAEEVRIKASIISAYSKLADDIARMVSKEFKKDLAKSLGL